MARIEKDECIAEAATATAKAIAVFPAFDGIFITDQLDDWKEAVSLLSSFKKNPNSYNWSKGIRVINLAGNSLVKLFGKHYQLQKRTPSLFCGYIEEEFPKKGWNLKLDDQLLYSRLEVFNEIYNLSKHMDRNKHEKARECLGTVEKLQELMETCRQVWVWFLQKLAGNQPVSSDQLLEFKEFL